MKVWIAESWEAYERSCIIGVFSSPYIAMCACMEYSPDCGNDWCLADPDNEISESWENYCAATYHGYSVYEWEVE